MSVDIKSNHEVTISTLIGSGFKVVIENGKFKVTATSTESVNQALKKIESLGMAVVRETHKARV